MGKEAKEAKKPKETVEEEKPKDGKEVAPPFPLEEVEMRVYMHCEGCARKVKKILMHFDGVEDVIADSKTRKVVVKGKKAAADQMKLVEHVQKKTRHKVELLSLIPPPPEEKKKEEKKEEPELSKLEEKKLPVIAVVLKVHIHCEICAQWIRKRILKMKGVQSADLDLKASEVTAKGVFEEAKLPEYVYKRIGKHTSIIKSEPVTPPESVGGNDKAKEEKKMEGSREEEEKEGDGDTSGEERDVAVIVAANLYMYYLWFVFPSRYYPSPPLARPRYVYQPAYPPLSYAPYTPHYQTMSPLIFSDENPNTCSIM